MSFDVQAQRNNSTRDCTLMKLLKSPGLMVSVSGVSKTIFLSSDLDNLCNGKNNYYKKKKLKTILT